MQIMKNLRAEGKSILFISHKLAEIMAVADRCSVLRRGKYIGTVDIKDTTTQELSRMMVGRDVQLSATKTENEARPTVAVVPAAIAPAKKISQEAAAYYAVLLEEQNRKKKPKKAAVDENQLTIFDFVA